LDSLIVPEAGCPLCPGNGKVDIMSDRGIAYLVVPKISPVDDCYLIVPTQHITDIRSLPDTWQVAVSYLMNDVPWFVPGESAYNLSLNVGKAAGQTLPHLHFWVIPRTANEEVPSYGLGAATLVQQIDSKVDVNT